MRKMLPVISNTKINLVFVGTLSELLKPSLLVYDKMYLQGYRKVKRTRWVCGHVTAWASGVDLELSLGCSKTGSQSLSDFRNSFHKVSLYIWISSLHSGKLSRDITL